MHFGILTQYYPPEVGAPQSRLSDLAHRFVERGHSVTVLTAMPNYPIGRIYPGYSGWLRREEVDGAKVIRTYIYPAEGIGLKRLASYFSFVFSSFTVGAVLLPRFDFVLTESPPLFLGISGFLLSRLKRSRWIFNVSDLWPRSAVELGVVDDGWQLRAANRLEALCYRKAFLVTGQSRGILDDIEGRFRSIRTYHLPHGVHPQRFRPQAPDPQIRRKLTRGMTASDPCIAIYTGLHGIAQGLDILLAAADRLRNISQLRLVLIGDGPEKEQLVHRARGMDLPNLVFFDPIPAAEVPRYLSAADIALAPLKKQLTGAVPSKIYEAMGSGVPIVVVGEAEPARIVLESGSGDVVTPGDIDSLVNSLRRLASDTELRETLGTAGRQAVLETYDRTQIGDRFISYLEEHH